MKRAATLPMLDLLVRGREADRRERPRYLIDSLADGRSAVTAP